MCVGNRPLLRVGAFIIARRYTYKGGEQKVFVPEKAPIITYAPGTKTALTRGSHVIVTATKNSDGALTATSVGVGKNGLVPPM